MLRHTQLGKYKRGVKDAQQAAKLDPSHPKSTLRMHSFATFDAIRADGAVGHDTAHITLLQTITPPEFKQW